MPRILPAHLIWPSVSVEVLRVPSEWVVAGDHQRAGGLILCCPVAVVLWKQSSARMAVINVSNHVRRRFPPCVRYTRDAGHTANPACLAVESPSVVRFALHFIAYSAGRALPGWHTVAVVTVASEFMF